MSFKRRCILSCLFLACLFTNVRTSHADLIAASSIIFSNIEIDPSAGTIVFLGPPPPLWTAQAFAEAHNSLGGSDSDFDESIGGTAAADAGVLYAEGLGAADAVLLEGFGSSTVEIPGCEPAFASSLGRGALFNSFMITGGTGLVNVDFSVDISGIRILRY